MIIEPRHLYEVPIGGEYLDATGARARVTNLLFATAGADLMRVVPYLVPDDDQQQTAMNAAILLLLNAFPQSQILEVSL